MDAAKSVTLVKGKSKHRNPVFTNLLFITISSKDRKAAGTGLGQDPHNDTGTISGFTSST